MSINVGQYVGTTMHEEIRLNETHQDDGEPLPGFKKVDCFAMTEVFLRKMDKEPSSTGHYRFEHDHNKSECWPILSLELERRRGLKSCGAHNREDFKNCKGALEAFGSDEGDPALWNPRQAKVFVWPGKK